MSTHNVSVNGALQHLHKVSILSHRCAGAIWRVLESMSQWFLSLKHCDRRDGVTAETSDGTDCHMLIRRSFCVSHSLLTFQDKIFPMQQSEAVNDKACFIESDNLMRLVIASSNHLTKFSVHRCESIDVFCIRTFLVFG